MTRNLIIVAGLLLVLVSCVGGDEENPQNYQQCLDRVEHRYWTCHGYAKDCLDRLRIEKEACTELFGEPLAENPEQDLPW